MNRFPVASIPLAGLAGWVAFKILENMWQSVIG